MVVGEIFLAALLQLLIDRLEPREIRSNFGSLHGGVGKRLAKWRGSLYEIAAVLNDAEEKQLTSKAVELWLDDLTDLAYDLEDILDNFSTDILRRKGNEQNGAGTSKVRSLIPKVKLFMLNMNSGIEDISHRLQAISEQKDMLGLKYVGMASTNKTWKRPSSSYELSGIPVVGRDNDKARIIELLSRDERPVKFEVVAIVGIPGVGKTTLAQFVLNENSGAMNQFNPKIWEYVSDEFNLVRVTRGILESVTSRPCHFEEFNSIQESLSKELAGKKFLLILDDVWNTFDYELWERLQLPFRSGAPGSKIIVTTRDAKVARTMGATEVYDLQCISHDNCWKIFGQYAFKVSNDILPNFGLLRDKVVARCSGLPLAARSLGGLLGSKEYEEWEEILNNELWSLSDEESDILPVLKLSYYYLPSSLKRCFAYCSIFPNGYKFGETQLILLWMAEGLLKQPKERKDMEDTGADYFGELLSRSLFQKSSKDNSVFVMHDLVVDLARWAAGELCFRLDDKPDGRCSSKTRHFSYVSGHYDGVQKFVAISEVKHLRTFLPFALSHNPHNYLSSKVTHHLLPDLKYLRVLSFCGYQITALSNSIAKLNHLKYLDLSHTLIVSLPESTSTLYNLQTLIVDDCSQLMALPAKMRNLTNLRHLKNSNVPLLRGMPPQLSQLTNLQSLPNFVVGKDSESSIREIGPLLHLKGTLRLSGLENVLYDEDARKTSLISKDRLETLQLEWSDTRENESVVLDMLKPHGNLKELTIKGYRGLEFSTWIGDPLFSNMVLVKLENCNHCQFLPPLGQLVSLKKLSIRGLSRVENVGAEFYGNGNLSFPILETLEFEDMRQWKEWCPIEGDQGSGVFPCMKNLSIKRCPLLEGKLPEDLDSLTKLTIHDCYRLVVSISKYKQLSGLDIEQCKELVHQSAVEFELLESVRLQYIPVLRLEMEGFMRGLRKVFYLRIIGCDKLISGWKNEDELLRHLISVRFLFYACNSHIVQFQRLTWLQELDMYRCANLVSFSEDCFPPSLKAIIIASCDSLTHFTRSQIPPSLRKIHIKDCRKLKFLVGKKEKWLQEGSSSSYCSMNEEASCLEELLIRDCPSIKSSSFRGQLPRALKSIRVSYCYQLESICDALCYNTHLEVIDIYDCRNLKSLPKGLYHLTNLQGFFIQKCGSLVSFPSGGLPRASKSIIIDKCYKLKALPTGMHNLNALQALEISECMGLAPILEDGFPANLTELSILCPYNCKPLSEWGMKLHRLNSLKKLWLCYVDPYLVSFPPENEMEMLLPKSLIKLQIEDFPNLRHLSSNGFQFLTSLESLTITNCPLLEFIPEGLPISITQLHIYDDCPLLRKRYKPSNVRHWATIAHIPFIDIGVSPYRRAQQASLRDPSEERCVYVEAKTCSPDAIHYTRLPLSCPKVPKPISYSSFQQCVYVFKSN